MPEVRLVDRPDFTITVADDSALLGDPRYELVPDQTISPTTQQTIDTTSTVQTDDGQFISSQDQQTFDTVTEQQADPLPPSPFFGVEGTETFSEPEAQAFQQGSQLDDRTLLTTLYPGMSETQISRQLALMQQDPGIREGYLFDYARDSQFQPAPEEFSVTGATPTSKTDVDPVTGEPVDTGLGVPESATKGGELIGGEEELQAKRDELANAGVPTGMWGQTDDQGRQNNNWFISSPDANGNVFFRRPATLYNATTGDRQVVPSGSPLASRLLSSGYTLGDGRGTDGAITSNVLKDEASLNTGGVRTDSGTYEADVLVAGAKADTVSTDEQLQRNIDLLTPPETELSRQIDSLIGGLDPESVGGLSELKRAEEERLGVQDKTDAVNAKNRELKKKIAEVEALDRSYESANLTEEGRPQTTFSLRGEQLQNFKIYSIKKNQLASEVGILQADLLALQGDLQSAQAAANSAIELEYQDRQRVYNARLNQLQILIPQLDKQEARYAEAVNLTLQQAAQATADEKQLKKDIQSLKLTAFSELGITDAGVLAKIGQAQSYDEALNLVLSNASLGTANDFQFITGTANQPGGIFNKTTGQFQPLTGSEAPGGLTYNVAPSGDMMSFEINGRGYQLDSVTQPSLDAINEASQQFGGLKIGAVATSTYRSREQQEELYKKYLANGPLAAPPGQSVHELGMAIDLFPDHAYIDQMQPIMNANGWYQTAGKHDAGHFEYLGVQGADTGLDPEVQSFVTQVQRNQLTNDQALKQISSGKKEQLAVALGGMELPENPTVLTLQNKLKDISTLLDHKGMNNAVGTKKLGRVSLFEDLTGEKGDFIAGIEQMISQETLDTLIEAKAQGATFGALSQTELNILIAAASKIGTWRVTDKNGKVVGYKTKESLFKKELQKIFDNSQGLLVSKGGSLLSPEEFNAIQSEVSGGAIDPSLYY